MVGNPFISKQLIGRQSELSQVSQILVQDGDLLLAGVPGIGRRTLIRAAAAQCKARVIEIDCLRATDYGRFLQLLAEALLATFDQDNAVAFIQQWSQDQPFTLKPSTTGQLTVVWHISPSKEWSLFEALLRLPQALAEWLDCRVVLVFQNFPHIRSWDRGSKWEQYLRQEIQRQTRVSYALIATVAERWTKDADLKVIALAPLPDRDLRAWIVEAMALKDLMFDLETPALELFLGYVQGHFGDAIALARRLWVDLLHSSHPALQSKIQPHQVYRSAIALVEDLSVTFESLILLLPSSQVRVLESLALDPTDSPHAREYIQKHNLSRGGGLQGALASLEQKGLVYGAEQGYRIALPLLAFWLKYRLG
ncbi:AAA family ATPase [Myxacorys almedinensis]|uniref:AAA family ATPase n=1 Tax=Myxacorys almedinensis A TaxID=2690445 RepID=A0A8J7YXA7_9CYAN|nr:AAA family ATPase [Myxacorys almedinensis]NDJ16362.1 AAA family ATPase [Myxacorys almedinensis A]